MDDTARGSWTEEDLALAFIRRGGARCPVCRYSLDGLGEARCPECGQRLRLSLAGDRGAITAWLVCVGILCGGTGFFLLLEVWIAWLLLVRGSGPDKPDRYVVLGGLVACGLGLFAVLRFSTKFRRARARVRWLLVTCAGVLVAGCSIVFFWFVT